MKTQPQQLNNAPEQTDEIRRATLGSSKFAGAIGLSVYESPLDVYEQQVGLVTVQSNFKMQYGLINEDLTRKRYESENLPDDWKVIIPPQKQHADEPWLTCHADGLVVDDQDQLMWGVEIKNTGSMGLVKDPPADWIFQSMCCMANWGLSRWDLVVQFANHDPVVHQIDWDSDVDRTWGKALKVARSFWFRNVVAGVPPVNGSGDLHRFSTKEHSPEYLQADPSLQRDIRALHILNKMIAALKKQKEPIKESICKSLQDVSGAEGAWGRVHYKLPKKSKKVDWRKVALSLHPEKALIDRYTTEEQSVRSLRPFIEEDPAWATEI